VHRLHREVDRPGQQVGQQEVEEAVEGDGLENKGRPAAVVRPAEVGVLVIRLRMIWF
jgi:hypothetical protein